jgi:hypothetical protein
MSKTISVPIHLCRLLLATPEDLKDPTKFADVNEMARTALAMLVAEAEPAPVVPKRRHRKRGLPVEPTTLHEPV